MKFHEFSVHIEGGDIRLSQGLPMMGETVHIILSPYQIDAPCEVLAEARTVALAARHAGKFEEVV